MAQRAQPKFLRIYTQRTATNEAKVGMAHCAYSNFVVVVFVCRRVSNDEIVLEMVHVCEIEAYHYRMCIVLFH